MRHRLYVPGGDRGGVRVRGRWVEVEVDHSGHSPGLVKLWEDYDRRAAELAGRPFLLFPPREEDANFLAHRKGP